jgi:nicotinamide-nucleotide amidase
MSQTLEDVEFSELDKQAREVLKRACDRDAPIATAESCTGGLLAALLTDIAGYSHIFERGFVVYSEQAKCDLLGIGREKVDNCGAVSREVAIAMADGALRNSEAAVTLAITGYAGPPGKDDDGEEGLVHFACGLRGGETQHREEHFGAIGRDHVRNEALRVSLEMIGQALER